MSKKTYVRVSKKINKKIKSSLQTGSSEYKTVNGKIVATYPDSRYSVELEDDGRVIPGYISGRMKINYIKIIPGDKVIVKISMYNDKICRIVRRIDK